MKLKFSHKILLAGCSIVILAFTLFALYNDYLQRNTIRDNLAFTAGQAGELSAGSVHNWLDGRIRLLQSLAENLALQDDPAAQAELVGQPSFGSQFIFTYLGGNDGSFIQRPQASLPEGYDPESAPGIPKRRRQTARSSPSPTATRPGNWW